LRKSFLFLFSVLIYSLSTAQVAVDGEGSGQIQAKELKAELSFSEGMKFFLIEDFTKAQAEFKKNINLYGDAPTVYYMLSRSEKELGLLNMALINAKKALDLDAQNYYYMVHLADIELKSSQYKAAGNTLKKAIKAKPSLIENYFKLVDIYIREGEESDAIKVLKDAEKIFGLQEEITQRKQDVLVRQNKVGTAIKEGEKISKNDPDFNLKQAILFIENKKPLEAINLLEKTMVQNPLLIQGYAILSDLYAQQENSNKLKGLYSKLLPNDAIPFAIKMGVFSNYFTLNKNDVANYSTVEEMLDELSKAYPKEARPYIFKADFQVKAKQILLARESYQKAVNLDPTIFEAWLAIVELDVRTGSFEEMKKHSEKAIEYFPNQAYFWYHNGFALMQLKEKEEALVSFEEALKLNGKNKELSLNIQANMANIYAELGKGAKAQALFEANLKDTPLHEQTLNDYSLYLIAKSEAKKSLSLTEQLIQNFPKQAGNFETYALALVLNNQGEKALKQIEAAIGMQENAKFLETKGDILNFLKRPEEAKQMWKKAQEKGNSSEVLKLKIKS
jgi:tetratricopeptide (TPR) repeat protein